VITEKLLLVLFYLFFAQSGRQGPPNRKILLRVTKLQQIALTFSQISCIPSWNVEKIIFCKKYLQNNSATALLPQK